MDERRSKPRAVTRLRLFRDTRGAGFAERVVLVGVLVLGTVVGWRALKASLGTATAQEGERLLTLEPGSPRGRGPIVVPASEPPPGSLKSDKIDEARRIADEAIQVAQEAERLMNDCRNPPPPAKLRELEKKATVAKERAAKLADDAWKDKNLDGTTTARIAAAAHDAERARRRTEELANQRSAQVNGGKLLEECVNGAAQGAYDESGATAGAACDAVAGSLPGIGTVGAVRDTAKAIEDVWKDPSLGNLGNVGLAVIGIVPGAKAVIGTVKTAKVARAGDKAADARAASKPPETAPRPKYEFAEVEKLRDGTQRLRVKGTDAYIDYKHDPATGKLKIDWVQGTGSRDQPGAGDALKRELISRLKPKEIESLIAGTNKGEMLKAWAKNPDVANLKREVPAMKFEGYDYVLELVGREGDKKIKMTMTPGTGNVTIRDPHAFDTHARDYAAAAR